MITLKSLSKAMERLAPSNLYVEGQVPSITGLCRKALLLQMIEHEAPGHFLEIGFGRGDWLLISAI